MQNQGILFMNRLIQIDAALSLKTAGLGKTATGFSALQSNTATARVRRKA
jgi:hypothetical protein